VAALHDPRDRDRVTHSLRGLVAQRLYGLCCGYEDLNDHDRLRHDVLIKIVVRGDSGFCRQRLLTWCERSCVGYVIGLARNARLQAQVSE